MKLSKLETKHIKQALRICGESLGEGFISEGEITEFITGAPKFGLVVSDGSRLLGLSLFARGTFDQISPFILEDKDWFRDEFGMQKNLGLRKTTVVEPLARGQGVGKMLMTAGMDELNLAEVVLSVVWQKDKNKITRMLQANGFSLLKPIPAYWHRNSLDKSYVCPACGGPPCTCEAAVFWKENVGNSA